MKVKILFSLLSLLFIFSNNQAQSLPKLKNDGLELFNAGKYAQALVLLQNYQRQKGDDRDVIRALGIAAYQSNQLALAKQMLSAIAEDKKADPSVFLYLGKVYHAELDFKNAAKSYKDFLRKTKADDPLRKVVVADVKRCFAGIKISIQPDLALVENLGENVNSLHDEFGPVLSPNDDEKIYFSAAREDAEGGLRTEEGLSDMKNGKYVSDIYFTSFESGDWTIPQHLENTLINSARHEVLLDFTNGGKTMYFFRGLTQFSGEVLVDTFKTGEDVRSLPPQFQSPMMASEGDNSLYFFNDTILLFNSRKAGGYGGLDLYYSIFSNGRWLPAKNFGSTINTAFDETNPYLAKDGRTLYFSSNSTLSMGGFDVYKSTFNDDSLRFMPAVNLGKPINSAGDDAYFRLTPDGMKAYFSSNRRDGGYGGRDIYTALFKGFQKEQTPSVPLAFHMVEDYKVNNISKTDGVTTAKIATFTFSPIFYDNDDDVLRGENLRQVKNALALIKQYSALKIILTVNSNEGEKASFDLYFGMKRAEKIAKYLLENGLVNENILIKSVGANYPVAKTFLDGNPNPAGEKMNRRIDLSILKQTTEPVKIVYDAPAVSQFMTEEKGDKLRRHAKGLSYKLQILTTKRIYDNELLSKYGDAMMEAVGTEGLYQYTVGLTADFASAEKIRKDLVKDGVRDAWVVPYVDGLRATGEEAKRFANRYTDLLNYLAAKKKP